MKYTLPLLFGLLMPFLIQAQHQHTSNCISAPYAITVKQPDGSEVTVIGRGNDDAHYTESIDGYTLLFNEQGYLTYAIPVTGGDLQPSDVIAHSAGARTAEEREFLQAIEPGFRYSPEVAAMKFHPENHSHNKQKPENPQLPDETVTRSFPTTGKRKVLFILMQYPDLPATYTKEDFINLLQQEKYKGNGSFRDFYLDNSNGQLDLEFEVMGWYTAENNYLYYGRDNGNRPAAELVAQAVDSAETAGVDFSQYDNDNDGNVDGVMVIHSGPGAEEGSLTKYIWSHRSSLNGSNSRTYDGAKIRNYAINPETRGGTAKRMVGIGVLCHEFGHLLGMPDLYDTNEGNGQSEGIGNWGIMGGGAWLGQELIPSMFSAYCRILMGWVQPKEISLKGSYTLKPTVDDTTIYRINTPVAHEYFLLENRQKKGWDKALPGHGLAIWHINDSVNVFGILWNNVNANDIKGVALEEADGLSHLYKGTNRGDGGDLFPGVHKITDFNATSKPSSLNQNGTESGISISQIEELPDSSVRFNFGPLPFAKFQAPLKVCLGDPVSLSNLSRNATNYKWDFGDGMLDSVASTPQHVYTTPGKYTISLTASNEDGESHTNFVQVEVLARAVADFGVTTNGLTVTITNNSQGATNYLWFWGDNTIGGQQQPTFTHKYNDRGTYVIKLIAMSNCSDTFEQEVVVDYGAGIHADGLENLQLSAFPNPVDDELNIRFVLPQEGRTQLFLVNALGQRTLIQDAGVLDAGPQQIRMMLGNAIAADGVYMIEVNVDGHPHYTKILKN